MFTLLLSTIVQSFRLFIHAVVYCRVQVIQGALSHGVEPTVHNNDASDAIVPPFDGFDTVLLPHRTRLMQDVTALAGYFSSPLYLHLFISALIPTSNAEGTQQIENHVCLAVLFRHLIGVLSATFCFS